MIRESTKAKYVGRKYGMMRIIEMTRRDPNHRHHYFVLCDCDCGVKKEVRLSCLQQGSTVSCGCYARSQTIIRSSGNTYCRNGYGENAKRTILARYRRDAARRGLRFDLTEDEFYEICVQPCFYCGEQSSRAFKPNGAHGEFIYTGVDRLDNEVGYTKENCVPSCRQCNSLKNAITKDMVFKLYHRLFHQT